MNDLIISIGSLIVGVVATVLVSRYYFKRSVDKSLTPYVQFFSSLFEGVDTSVRDSLKIAYKGTPVNELLEVQFLIANTGERSIRDVIRPLSLAIPAKCSLLDASILHVSPEGREVKISQSEGSVDFGFALLNSGEFFITKLLLHGKATLKDFKFSITVDDLPPTIPAVLLPYNLIESEWKREFEWGLLLLGLILIVIGSALAGLIYTQWPLLLMCWQIGLVTSFPKHWLVMTSSAVGSIPALILLVLGPMVVVGAFTNFSFSFPKRRRFRIPGGFQRRGFYIRHLIEEQHATAERE
jgi:hypothetical protein